ncbi:hypothetical protein XPA_001404 [Xanthoria parietina]
MVNNMSPSFHPSRGGPCTALGPATRFRYLRSQAQDHLLTRRTTIRTRHRHRYTLATSLTLLRNSPDRHPQATNPISQTSDTLLATAQAGNVPTPGVPPTPSSPEDVTYASTIEGTRRPCSAVSRVVRQPPRGASRARKTAIDTKRSIDRTFLASGEGVIESSVESIT